MLKNIFTLAIFCCLILGCASEPKQPPLVGDGQEAGDRKGLTMEGVQYVFRWCPAGTFVMGAPEDEFGNYIHETQHEVTLTQGFWMLETPVTQEMWQSVMGNNPSYTQGFYKDSRYCRKRPVERVTWDECQEYVEKLNNLKVAPEGYKFSLPTEAQWEYACRAGTTTAFNNGKNVTTTEWEACPNMDEVGWYRMNSESWGNDVGLKKPNAWGLHDMHGSVYEWCLDRYDYDNGDYPSGSVTDPTGVTTGTDCVFRGGSLMNEARFCRSAYRCNGPPASRSHEVGLRLVLIRETAAGNEAPAQ